MAFRQPQDKPKIQSKPKGVRNTKDRAGKKIPLEIQGNEGTRGKVTVEKLVSDINNLADMGTRVFVRPTHGLMRRPSGSRSGEITQEPSHSERE